MAEAGEPQPLGPSRWILPDPDGAEADGVVGLGADLEPETLVDAYRRGIFPWPHGRMALPWFSPDPRAVLRSGDVHVSRSLRRTLRRSGWTTTVDADLEGVIAGCADRPPAEGTWIDRRMRQAYRRLHHLGWVHSLEVWEEDRLVGGVYGVRVGACFTGESMFSRAPDGSKVALVDLCRRWGAAGGVLVDVQLPTPHLATMGAVEVPRAAFLAELATLRDRSVRMVTDRLAVSRLAEAAGRSSPALRPEHPAGP